ncbi:hypothetical protein [Streptomyces tricolor]|uniref:hypothetical protein n=1 Tax=Streptomyces tricolor TaxID=68277 RepID=UPI0036E759E4
MRLSSRFAALAGAALTVAALVGSTPASAGAVPDQAGDGGHNAHGQWQRASEYLNLHQCVYFPLVPAGAQRFTTLVPSRDGRFATGTNISTTQDPQGQPSCGPGNGNFELSLAESKVLGVDLTAGRYLNLHQCVYYNSFTRDHFTVVVPIDTDFSAGTNVSNTPDTAPSCADGNGIFQLIPLLSGVKALDQNAGRYVNLQQCVYYSDSHADHFTTVVPSRDGRFATGTNISNTPNSTPSCGRGDGNFLPIPVLSGVKALPLT